MHIQIYIEALEAVNTEWKQFIQQISVSTKRKEEDRYLQMNDDGTGIIDLIFQAKQTVVSLKMYQSDSEFILQRLNVREETVQSKESTKAVKYPAGLRCNSGELQHHKKCSRRKIRAASRIKSALFNELYSIKRNHKEWKVTLKALERTLRQLEAIEQIYKKRRQESWSVTKLRNFLTEFTSVNEEVAQSQSLYYRGNEKNQFSTKETPRPRYNPSETSALTTAITEKSTTTRTEIGVEIGRDRTMLLEANIMDYPTNKLQVANLYESDIRSLKGSPTINPQ
ncbi:unnamed protein product [Acanthocheilonema viteae]|uniref:Uncharacterized protein n=1 Tax=Acanthocheilonema viteae TaxID=6277 RepID=A0A498S9P1_ACAVI|nr:unnamed protein product [Acanthocheilonema viteae]